MKPSLSIIKRYAPRLILDRLVLHPKPLDAPFSEKFEAAILFADITRFTKLTEELSNSEQGIKELTDILDIYIGEMVEIITSYGGDIVKFAGDALFAIWRTSTQKDLANETYRATQCGLAIQKRLDNYEVKPGRRLTLRVGVGAGRTHALHIGGTFERWELLVAGEGMNQVAVAGTIAKPGQVVISPQAGKLMQNIGAGLKSNNKKFLFKIVNEIPITCQPAIPHIPDEAEPTLLAYIPRAITARAHKGDKPQGSEVRQVSILFCNVSNFSFGEDTDVNDVQKVMKIMQKSLYEFMGSINRFGIDDKGSVLLAAFGLPPLDHKDDPLRAVNAAIMLRKELKSIGYTSNIGVSTGQIFIGSVGNATRAEYTFHGPSVNFAARLMQNTDSILVDQTTRDFLAEQVKFEELPAIKVKGKDVAVPVFKPLYFLKS